MRHNGSRGMTSVSQSPSGRSVRLLNFDTGHVREAVVGDLLGEGASSTVWSLQGEEYVPFAVKLYRDEAPLKIIPRIEELRSRRLNEVAIPGRRSGELYSSFAAPMGFAMPTDTVRIVGLLLPRVDTDNLKPLHSMWGTPSLDALHNSVATASSLWRLISFAHSVDVVLGDISDANLYVSDNGTGIMSVIDVDSFAPRSVDKERNFEPTHATDNYRATELLESIASKESDVFAASVVTLQMLLGVHPFSGIPSGVANPTPQVNIDASVSWLLDRATVRIPPPYDESAGLDSLPSRLANALARGIASSAAERPEADEVARAFDDWRIKTRSCGHEAFISRPCPRCPYTPRTVQWRTGARAPQTKATPAKPVVMAATAASVQEAGFGPPQPPADVRLRSTTQTSSGTRQSTVVPNVRQASKLTVAQIAWICMFSIAIFTLFVVWGIMAHRS